MNIVYYSTWLVTINYRLIKDYGHVQDVQFTLIQSMGCMSMARDILDKLII